MIKTENLRCRDVRGKPEIGGPFRTGNAGDRTQETEISCLHDEIFFPSRNRILYAKRHSRKIKEVKSCYRIFLTFVESQTPQSESQQTKVRVCDSEIFISLSKHSAKVEILGN